MDATEKGFDTTVYLTCLVRRSATLIPWAQDSSAHRPVPTQNESETELALVATVDVLNL